MKKLSEFSQVAMKTCSMCSQSSEAEGFSLIHFGEWITKKDITVHYYCLLLSTHLPQRGEDHSGILGFLLRDVRHEITMAKKRQCMYCLEMCATIQCAKCKKYFHITCGHTSKCLSQFVGEFKSYCHACVPADEYQPRKLPKSTDLCFICRQMMGTSIKRCIYAKCCGSGFTHSKCMKMYALSAGYYLTCIWCKDKRFREDIKYLGVFVPDREAKWEKDKGAYGELYQRHKRCDMDICKCDKGRDYINAKKWQLIVCKLCGAFGAHNPICIPASKGSKDKLEEFKCDLCSATEQTVIHRNILASAQSVIDTSLYVNKDTISETVISQRCNINSFSGMILSQQKPINDEGAPLLVRNDFIQGNVEEPIVLSPTVYTLTQSPRMRQVSATESDILKMEQEENINSEDSATVDFLVEKMMNMFE